MTRNRRIVRDFLILLLALLQEATLVFALAAACFLFAVWIRRAGDAILACYTLLGLGYLAVRNLPASLPHIVSGTKQGWAFAWRSLMAAEIYIVLTDASGLGYFLHHGRELGDRAQVFGIMVLIIVIGFAADKLLFSPWETFLRRRWGLSKS